MFFISDVSEISPDQYTSELQQKVYEALEQLQIPFERVTTDEAISMDDCILINEKLNMEMVKTLFLCNRKKTMFYLFITAGDKAFDTKAFCEALHIPRVSFVPPELFTDILGTKIGAATVFSALADRDKTLQIIFDQAVITQEYYGCSDGTTTGYMKLKTADVLNKILPFSRHRYQVVEIN